MLMYPSIILPARLANVEVDGLETLEATLPRLNPLLNEPRPALLPPI